MHSEGRAATTMDLLLAVRPWSFPMTAVSMTMGSLMALPTFDWTLYLFTLTGMIIVHAATNLINDYFDVRHGVDRLDSPTARYRPHPLLRGTLHPRQTLGGALVLYALALLIAIYLTILRGWPIAVIAALGGLASFFYTAGPVKYKHRALGEFSVFFMWGPLMMLGSYYVQTGNWDHAGTVLWASLPIGLWVALVLLANNLKDIDDDRSQGLATLGTLLGRKGALQLYALLVIATYLVSGLAIAIRAIPLWGLMVVATLPMAWKLVHSLRSAQEIPPDADPRTAQLATLFGLLLIASLLVNHFIP